MRAWSILGLPGTQSPARLGDLSPALSSGCQPSLLLSPCCLPESSQTPSSLMLFIDHGLGKQERSWIDCGSRVGNHVSWTRAQASQILEVLSPFQKAASPTQPHPQPSHLLAGSPWLWSLLNFLRPQFLHQQGEEDKSTPSSSNGTTPSGEGLEATQLSLEWYSGWIQAELGMREVHPTSFGICVMFS